MNAIADFAMGSLKSGKGVLLSVDTGCALPVKCPSMKIKGKRRLDAVSEHQMQLLKFWAIKRPHQGPTSAAARLDKWWNFALLDTRQLPAPPAAIPLRPAPSPHGNRMFWVKKADATRDAEKCLCLNIPRSASMFAKQNVKAATLKPNTDWIAGPQFRNAVI